MGVLAAIFGKTWRYGLVLERMKTADCLSSPYQRYAHSKLANILFARKLSQLYPSIQSVSYSPGHVKTDLFKKATGVNKWLKIFVFKPLLWLISVSPEKGAKNGIWVAVSPNLVNGAYYEPVGILVNRKGFLEDQKLTDELWNWTSKELAEHGAWLRDDLVSEYKYDCGTRTSRRIYIRLCRGDLKVIRLEFSSLQITSC